VADNGAIVPALWRLEVANSLTVALRRHRIDADFRRAALADLALLDITTENPSAEAWGQAIDHRLRKTSEGEISHGGHGGHGGSTFEIFCANFCRDNLERVIR
jgi:hypothetical protein